MLDVVVVQVHTQNPARANLLHRQPGRRAKGPEELLIGARSGQVGPAPMEAVKPSVE